MHQDAARNTVAVIVTPYRDFFSRSNCARESFGRFPHIGHQEWVVEMVVVGRIQKLFCVFFRQDAAAREERSGEIVIRYKFFAQGIVYGLVEWEHVHLIVYL